MLEAKNITYRVGNKTLLNNVSVSFLPGKLNFIIGANGAGKSTLVKVLSNQLQPQHGTIFYGEKSMDSFSLTALAKVRAALSQNIELAFPLTVSEVVMMGRYPHFSGKPKIADYNACKEAMQFFDVFDMADRNYLTLSGGEKQRVNFARAMAQIWYPVPGACRYLLLDEPLTFLDVHYQFQFMYKIIDLLKAGDLVVVGVIHDLNLAAKFADQIVLLHQAQVLASGTPQIVLNKENIKTAYQLEPVIYEDNNTLHLFF